MFSLVVLVPVLVGVFLLEFYWRKTLGNFIECPQDPETRNQLQIMEENWKDFFFIPITFYALLEEIAFRFFPFMFAHVANNGIIAILIIFPSQFLFGIVHGNIRNVGFQGVGGILYTFLFMAFGGIKSPMGIIAATIAHTLWNLNCRYEFFQKFSTKLKLST